MDPASTAAWAIGAVDLVTNVFNHDRITVPGDIIASFTDLQAERFRQIQSEIIKLRSERLSRQNAPGVLPLEHEDLLHTTLGEALNRYAEALRDYDTLSQETLQSNPFEETWWHILLPGAIQKLLFKPPLTPYPEIAPYTRVLRFRELDKKGRLLRERKYTSIERLLLGSFGGIMLIGPMLLMVLNYNRSTTLITTSVATVVFTLMLAVFARGMAGKDVLGAVAAYAAVLVVFVGTSITPISSA